MWILIFNSWILMQSIEWVIAEGEGICKFLLLFFFIFFYFFDIYIYIFFFTPSFPPSVSLGCKQFLVFLACPYFFPIPNAIMVGPKAPQKGHLANFACVAQFNVTKLCIFTWVVVQIISITFCIVQKMLNSDVIIDDVRKTHGAKFVHVISY